jgi:maleylpyruvate isomerase
MSDPTVDADLARLSESTSRLVAVTDSLDDATVGQPSLLPGWTVGHVLTHLARNADGLLGLVTWAETGVVTSMYTSMAARVADIDAGAGRAAAELARDVRMSAERLAMALAGLSSAGDEALDRLVLFGAPPPGTVPDVPARTVPYARLRELEIHHVDLGLPSYGPAQWPADFVSRTLGWLDARSGPVDVVGDPAEVLAWRLGRGSGASVRRRDGGDPGDPPSWM